MASLQVATPKIPPSETSLGSRVVDKLGRGAPLSVLEAQYGLRFQGVTGRDHIEIIMQSAGLGSRGIVAGVRDAPRAGHVFNVVNQNGTIRFLDGQTGRAAAFENQGYIGYGFLRTN